MSEGRLRVEVAATSLNQILERVQEANMHYQNGCFVVHRKLPMGFGATLVAIPSQRGPDIIVAVPFDQIKGDRLGGFAGTVAKALWGLVSGQVRKVAEKALLTHGLPKETVSIESMPGGGMIRISLVYLNFWLGKKGFQGLCGQVATADFDRDSLTVGVDVERVS